MSLCDIRFTPQLNAAVKRKRDGCPNIFASKIIPENSCDIRYEIV